MGYRRARGRIWRPLCHNGRPAGPLALQFACFDASSGIQGRIGVLNHSEEGGRGGTNQLSVDLGAVYRNCHSTHVYKPRVLYNMYMCYTYCI